MKNVLSRLALGAGMGVVIGYIVNIIISMGIGKGNYLPVMPQLQAWCSSEINAVLLQTLLTALIGIVFAETGLIFEIAAWSFLKQCVVHFCISAPFFIPFMVLCWFPIGWVSVLSILANVLFTYTVTFFIVYHFNLKAVRQINAALQEKGDFNQNIVPKQKD